MAEQKIKEKKIEQKTEMKQEKKTDEKMKTTDAPLNKEHEKIIPQEKKVENKVESVKPEVKKVEVSKKSEAVTRGNDLHVSMKQCMFICRVIKNKTIDDAIVEMEKVIAFKKAIPMTGEIPHRKGNLMSGRYPITACALFIPLLKTLKGNVLANKMDLDKTRIYFASSSYASRPSKKGGGRFKRANIILKAKEFSLKENKK